MADTKQNNEAAFTSWLSENVSASQQLSELYMALVEIEQQAKKVRLVKRSLYETIDPPAVKKIRANIEQSKIFRKRCYLSNLWPNANISFCAITL